MAKRRGYGRVPETKRGTGAQRRFGIGAARKAVRGGFIGARSRIGFGISQDEAPRGGVFDGATGGGGNGGARVHAGKPTRSAGAGRRRVASRAPTPTRIGNGAPDLATRFARETPVPPISAEPKPAKVPLRARAARADAKVFPLTALTPVERGTIRRG